MANSNLTPLGLTTKTVTSLQTRTSTSVLVFSAFGPIGDFSAPTEAFAPTGIIGTETSRIVTVFTATLTIVATITDSGTTPTLVPVPTTVTPGPRTQAASVLTIPSSPGSPFFESPGLISSNITPPTTSLENPRTGISVLPSGAPGHKMEDSNQTLERVLPSVLPPLLFIVILVAYYIFLRRRRRRRLTPIPSLLPFNLSSSSSTATFHGNMFATKKQGRATTNVGEEILNISRRSSDLPSHRGRGVVYDSRAEQDVLPVEETELPAASLDNLLVPVSRSEILELQTRLADIEARRISLPPPEYSSERG